MSPKTDEQAKNRARIDAAHKANLERLKPIQEARAAEQGVVLPEGPRDAKGFPVSAHAPTTQPLAPKPAPAPAPAPSATSEARVVRPAKGK